MKTSSRLYLFFLIIAANLISCKSNEPVFPEGTLVDFDGNIYKTVTIGTQTWMAENLRTTHFNNGDLIPTTSTDTLDTWNEAAPVYQWAYTGYAAKSSFLGRLYTWYAVNDSRGIAPKGWHVATDVDWNTLDTCLTKKGLIAKSMADSVSWNYSSLMYAVGNDTTKNNVTGFSARATGVRNVRGKFSNIRLYSNWWSASSLNPNQSYANYRYLYYKSDKMGLYSTSKSCGLSVRCVKDN